MSYSIHTRAATKAEAIEKFNEQMDMVVAQQPLHEIDVAAAKGAIASITNLLAEDADCDIATSASGSIYSIDGTARTVGLSINVSLIAKDAA